MSRLACSASLVLAVFCACQPEPASWTNVPACQGPPGADFERRLVAVVAGADEFFSGGLSELPPLRASRATVAIVDCSGSVRTLPPQPDAWKRELLRGNVPRVCERQRTVHFPAELIAAGAPRAFRLPDIPASELACARGN